MGSYLIRRVLQGVGSLLGVMLLLHLLMTLAIQLNGNPALAFFGERVPSKSQLAAVEERFGLADPCYDQPGNPCVGPFVKRMGDYLTGDFGTNHRGREVADIVATAAPNTLRLFVIVTITWMIAGMLLGSVAARFRGRAPDHSIRFLSILIDAFPVFVMLLVYKFIVTVPVSNWMSDRFGDDSLPALLFKPSFSPEHPWATVIIPGLLLGLAGAAPFLRLVRASQLENYNADHVRTARAKGLGDTHVAAYHIVRNSAIPVITAVGFVFAEALAGAVITEGMMNIYGMGGVLWDAVRGSEVSVVIGVVTILAVITIAVMLLVDLLYAVLDPRIRYD
ncbi:ABC transporter permease [Microlunatus sp. GCM10028923]|uniref:ABC transporter permease n=1 Tax=Microlunatus sp. GCM10028923 TaxID=3273400 RepID=UPI00361383F1